MWHRAHYYIDTQKKYFFLYQVRWIFEKIINSFRAIYQTVFFSTDYCSSVKDFQCAPKILNSSAKTMTSSGNNVINALKAMNIIMFLIFIVLDAILVCVCVHSQHKTKVILVGEVKRQVHHYVEVFHSKVAFQ